MSTASLGEHVCSFAEDLRCGQCFADHPMRGMIVEESPPHVAATPGRKRRVVSAVGRGCPKLHTWEVVSIRERYERGATLKDLATDSRVSATAIYAIVRGLSYKHAGGPIRSAGGHLE